MIANIFILGIGFFLLLAAFLDLKTRIIPNWIPIMILICGVAAGWFNDLILDVVVGAIIFLLLALLLSSVEIMGGGDLKLIASLGASLTLSNLWILNGFIFSFFIGLMFILLGVQIVALRALNKPFHGAPLAHLLFLAWFVIQLFF